MHDHAARRDRLRDELASLGLDALYVTDPVNVRYLTGFTGSNGQAVATIDGPDLLVTDERYDARARAEAPGLAIELTRDPVRAALEQVTPGRLGFEAEHLSYRQGLDLVSAAAEHGLEAVPVSGAVERLRIVKDDTEVACIRHACALTSAALLAVMEDLGEGITERELAVRIERAMVDRGADGIAFDLIVASGPNGAIPHHAPTDRPLRRGELVTFDVGARVEGYHADMTRTVALGEPPAQLLEVYEVVRAAQQAGVAAVVGGTDTDLADAAAREVIDAAGYGEQFVHGLGHGVGLQVHEAPWFRSPAATIPAATIVTVEPGIYLPGLGGVRIEDTLLVTDGDAERLTDAPRDLLVL